MKPFAESCEENKDPILAILRRAFADRRRILEIGSGTGQHACHFAAALHHLTWQTSDREANHAGIRAWLAEGPPNTLPPLALDVCGPWPRARFDGVFSANTVHIMAWPEVECLFTGLARVLEPGGVFALYGPFNYSGRFTSESNARFDAWLKARDPASGIRDVDDLNRLGETAGLKLEEDLAMPANNRTLLWRKR